MFDPVKMNEWVRRNPATLSRRIEELEAINAEMLEALEVLCDFKRDCPCEVSNEELAAWDNARAAVAKAKGVQP